VHQDRLVLDMRSVFPEQDELLAGVLRQILSTAG